MKLRVAIACGAVLVGSCGGREPPGPARPVIAGAGALVGDGSVLGGQEQGDAGTVDYFHGVSVRDPFRWLEGNDATVAAWVDAQDKRARAFLSAIPGREDLVGDLEKTRGASGVTSFPSIRGSRYLFEGLDAKGQHSAVFAYDGATKRIAEVVDLDPSSIDGLTSTWWSASPNGRYLLFRMSPHGNEVVQARIFDTSRRIWLPDHIADIRHSSPDWDPSSSGFYYTWSPDDPSLSAADRAAKTCVRFHRLGSPAEQDDQLRPPSGVPGAIEMPGVSVDGRWLVVVRWYDSEHTSLYLHDNREAHDAWRQLSPEGPSQYLAWLGRGFLYVATNEGAKNKQIFRVEFQHPERQHWQLVVPERADAPISDVEAFGEDFVVQYLRDAEPVFEVHGPDGSLLTRLDDTRLGTLSAVSSDARTSVGLGLFNSYTQIPMPYRASVPKFHFDPLPYLPPPPNAASKYVTEKLFYTSPDGTRAPVFVVHAATRDPKQPAPLIVSGYGASGENTGPHYIRGLNAWLDRGGVYAEAIIRGGGEYGNAWHQAGMRRARGNTYADFIAASDYLIKEGWTTPSQLVAWGGSSGGLLVTVAATQRPDLYAGIVAEVPITDMIRLESSGIGSLLVSEFGKPDDPDDFPVLLRYSPYHSVHAGVHYPAFLLLSNADDDRITPMHARKFAAAVEAADPADTVLLRTRRDAAHEGAPSEAEWVDTQADIYAFARAVTHGTQHSGQATP